MDKIYDTHTSRNLYAYISNEYSCECVFIANTCTDYNVKLVHVLPVPDKKILYKKTLQYSHGLCNEVIIVSD